jgi:hypothetical protein
MASMPLLSDSDYDAIEAAVMETARGRWFLAEFARRNRHADTRMLLDALARLETVIREERAALATAEEIIPTNQPMSGEARPGREDCASQPAEPMSVVSPPICASAMADDLTPPSLPHNGDEKAEATFGSPAWGENAIVLASSALFPEVEVEAGPELSTRPHAPKEERGDAIEAIAALPPRAGLGPMAQAIVSRSDPLAAVVALSYEEKIALFS